MKIKQILSTSALVLAGSLALAGCSGADPLATESDAAQEGGESIVVGSQAYYSNEIVAEIYAQALEGAGMEVERKFSIGQRDAYMPQLEDGSIDVFPEYTGNLLQFYKEDTEARSADEVYSELKESLPESLAVLEAAPASDQDSYTVTKEFAEANKVASIEDLAGISEPLTVGGPPELAQRPYGPQGLESVYGVKAEFSATGDTTVEDLAAGTVNVANVFTADPRIQTEDLVVLEDPKSLFLASNVVPLVAADQSGKLAEVLNPVSEKLTAQVLVDLNVQSTVDKKSAADIASAWLTSEGL
ncbi:osmoprotectant transport system substrate-binding protein [Arthrobacter sp. JUb119]|uniref:ABC transporter substrate-binding protein n=1 Tax=Micrococcaceae TaxID=1268 RepID=UPI000CFBE5B4|nr:MULTISPECIES: ABC transporter substrate-binding protein [unclassified Arthrobacter]MCS3492742.1 osmoprotectant transport system substrate-binding protein [Arthrobacter sp. JUb119]PQZ86272.1 glycine/betaine ABC transporter [Arthrobacter sp. MYb222]PRB77005.1 glycine/betaine ABC transporter [Arthrobacter sp. MYb214]